MGGEPWSYFVPFNASVEAALEALRQQVFETGQYRGSELAPATIEEAFVNAAESGTASILDMTMVGDEPDFCTVAPLSTADLERHFGTDRPTHDMVAKGYGLFEDIDRGQGIYVVVYQDDMPTELFFAGYSFD